jgi:hypothetical protein
MLSISLHHVTPTTNMKQLSMNHAGHEFGDLDVDTDSNVVLEHCLLKGNGEHGREQYSVSFCNVYLCG